jgi:apolipoprotein D and lipocalin family protein
MKSFVKPLFLMVSSALFSGCTGIPRGIRVVEDFDVARYQGTWHEIARLDHRFERGLTHVAATYTPKPDGSVDVENRGYDPGRGRWKSVRGRAYSLGAADKGRLKVTFFWPFYGAYNVIALDHETYSYAMVCGPSRAYLWILARENSLPAPILDALLAQAKELGFRTETLIFVPQQDPPKPDTRSEAPTPET